MTKFVSPDEVAKGGGVWKIADGHMYDLDVFMTGPNKDHLQVTDVSIHKKDGVARYGRENEGTVWKKEPVKKETS